MAKFWAKFFLFLLIEIFSAIFRCAEAQNFFVFNREFVVISDFFSVGNGLFGVNDNFLLAVNGNDFSITIRLKKEKKFREIFEFFGQILSNLLTSKLWLINLAKFPHLVASIT